MNRKSSFILALILSLARINSSADELHKYPKMLDYTNVTVTKISADSISIIHQDGATRIPFEKIPEDVRKDLGLSQESIDKQRQQIEMRKLENAASEVLFSRVSGKVLQVLDGGVLVTDAKQWLGTMKKDSYFDTSEYATITTNIAYELPIDLCFVACNTNGIVDGQTFTKIVAPTGNYSYVSALNVRKTCLAFTCDLISACQVDPRIKLLSSENIIRNY